MLTSKIHRNSIVTPNEINYIWKMIRKIQPIHLYHLHACLNNLNLLYTTIWINGIWNVMYGVWIWILDSNQLHLTWLLVALAQTTSYCHVMSMHHIVHCIDCVSFSVAGNCPLSIDAFQRCDQWHQWRTILSLEVPGKQNPLVHSDTNPLSRSCSLLLH